MQKKKGLILAAAFLSLTAMLLGFYFRNVRNSNVPSPVSSYSLSYKNSSLAYAQTGKGEALPSHTIDIDLKGQIITKTEPIAPSESQDASERVFVRWISPTISFSSEGVELPLSEQVAQFLSEGFYFDRDEKGNIVSLAAPSSEAEKIAESISLEIVSLCNHASLSSEEKWDAQEGDAYGPYRVSFGWNADRRELKKSSKVYSARSKPSDVPMFDAQREILKADLEITFSGETEGSFSSVKGSQTITATVNDQPLFLSQTELNGTSVSLDQEQIASLDKISIRKQISLKNFVRTTARPKVAPKLEDLEKAVTTLRTSKDVRDEYKVVQQITDYVDTHPDKTRDILRLFKDFDPASVPYMVLIRGLTSSNDLEVQSRYLAFIDEMANSEGAYVILLASTAEFAEPTAELLSKIKYYSENPRDDVRSTAILASGAIAHKFVMEADPRANDIVAQLTEKLPKTPDLNEKSTIWGALGNSGHPDVLGEVREAYSDSPESLKPRLINALRFVEGQAVNDFILEELESGATDAIRLACIEALLYRRSNPEMLMRVLAAMEKEKYSPALSQILTYLWVNKRFDPRVEPQLRAFLKNHPDNDAVREMRMKINSESGASLD